MSLDDVGRYVDGRWVTYGEAIDLVNELMRDLGSHLCADLAGWKFASSYGELTAAIHAEAYLNVHRDAKKQRSPIELLHPWQTETERTQVSPEERKRLKARLIANSVFRDTK